MGKKADIRLAVEDDLDDLVVYAERINDESSHDLTFDRDRARQHLRMFVTLPGWDILLAEIDGRVVGGAMIAESFEFHRHPLCYVCKFWVMPCGRRSDAGRKLVKALIAWAEERKCSDIFVTATAGLDRINQWLFIKLMSAAGFKQEGPVMKYEIAHRG
jgi:GNAT superfamily N-acetyltransferase|tara:strand:+ start:1592 stop:2068 length:477 start_codon:yes stop_codon:yes gene_type:complete